MIWLYLYFTGYIVTLFGLLTHLKYHAKRDYYGEDNIDGQDIFLRCLHAFGWPIIIMYFAASRCAVKLQIRKAKQLKHEKEMQKLLKEAGF